MQKHEVIERIMKSEELERQLRALNGRNVRVTTDSGIEYNGELEVAAVGDCRFSVIEGGWRNKRPSPLFLLRRVQEIRGETILIDLSQWIKIRRWDGKQHVDSLCEHGTTGVAEFAEKETHEISGERIHGKYCYLAPGETVQNIKVWKDEVIIYVSNVNEDGDKELGELGTLLTKARAARTDADECMALRELGTKSTTLARKRESQS